MALPHAAAVAALVISQFGHADPSRPGTLAMAPWRVERRLLATAAEHSCPTPRLQTYAQEGRTAAYDAKCNGGRSFNGFYGHGILNAHAAVAAR